MVPFPEAHTILARAGVRRSTLRLVRWTFGLLLLAVVLPACAVQSLGDGQQASPGATESTASGESVASTAQALSSVSCKMHGATGYKSGTPFKIKVVTVDGKSVEWATANAYLKMAHAAAKAGVQIRVVSGFRTMAEQRHLYYCYTSCSCNSCNLAAVPGTSNHQSGHALDLNTSSPGVYSWLAKHAAHYGFKLTVPGESWHWEWWGKDNGTGPCNGHILKAKLVKRWSNAKRYHGTSANYLACTGDKVKLSFTFKNVGSARWRDVTKRGHHVGSDVFLVTANGRKDPITHHKRYSIRWNKNRHVRSDRKAPNCSKRNGCRKTTFIRGGIVGHAPKKPGIYRSRWRLRDYSKVWGKHSKGFGPKAQIKLKVIKCVQRECGCKVWCSDGKAHTLSSSIQSDAQCKTAAANYCRPGNGQGSLYLYSYKACQAGIGGATSTASDPNGAASTDTSSGGAGGAGDTTDGAGEDGAFQASFDPGDEDDPNSIGPTDDGSPAQAVGTEEPDDPDFVDDGYPGYDAATDSAPLTGCSVAGAAGSPASPGPLPFMLAGLAGLLVIRRRRAQRPRCRSMRRVALAGLLPLLMLLFVGCGDERGEPAHAGYDLGSTSQGLSTKCGKGKYSGVQGMDVSEFQQTVNWKAMRHNGIDFAFARVSYGTGHIDPYFKSNWKHMKAAGVLRGVYQYFLPSQSASAQAKLVVKYVGKLGRGDLPAMIDVETNDGQSASTVASKVKTWLEIVEKGTGKRPIIYTGAYFWEGSVRSKSFSRYPLWIAAYGPSCPSLPNGWGNWKIWQYCDGQKQYCSNGHGFDRDVFNGSKADLLKLAQGNKTLKAKAVRKWSNARRYHGKAADYLACTGDKVKISFTFKNVGSAKWRDVTGRGKHVGSDVFLVTANGRKDPLTHHKRYSIRWNKNRHVRGDRKAKNCSNRNGCRKTTFIRGGMVGHAPKKPGVYRSRWRLRDYSKAWGKHSRGFGHKVQIKLKVIKCEQQDCGCKVWCSDGKAHTLSSSIQSDAQCKTAAANYCRPGNGQGSLYLYSYKACQMGLGGASSTSSGSSGGATSTASDPNGTASTDTSSGGAGGAAGDMGSDGTSYDEGGEDDPNSIPILDNGDDSQVEDDPGFSDDGFNGDADSTGDVPAQGCSVAAPGRRGGKPAALALLLLATVIEIRRRRRRS